MRAIVPCNSIGYALAVSKRPFKPDDQITVYSRSFVVRVHPLGDVVGTPWTSWAPALRHDAVRAIDLCGNGYRPEAGPATTPTSTRNLSRSTSSSTRMKRSSAPPSPSAQRDPAQWHRLRPRGENRQCGDAYAWLIRCPSLHGRGPVSTHPSGTRLARRLATTERVRSPVTSEAFAVGAATGRKT